MSSAGPSRPASGRTMRVHVAPREDGELAPTIVDDLSALRLAEKKKADLRRRSERWADRLMEETVSRVVLKKALAIFTPSQYDEITHERHLNDLCSYPACPNRPRGAWNPNKKFSISRKELQIRSVKGNAEEGWCSAVCRRRSEYVRAQLAEEGVWLRPAGKAEVEIVLLEDMESTASAVQPVNPARQDLPMVAARPPDPAAPFGSLTIRENPIPVSQPAPPSLDSPPPPPMPPPSHPLPPSEPASSRRAASAMTPATKLGETVISLSSAMGPMRQLAPDSEGEESGEEEEWAREMGWGEGEEVDGLFEQARAAQALLAAEEDGAVQSTV